MLFPRPSAWAAGDSRYVNVDAVNDVSSVVGDVGTSKDARLAVVAFTFGLDLLKSKVSSQPDRSSIGVSGAVERSAVLFLILVVTRHVNRSINYSIRPVPY